MTSAALTRTPSYANEGISRSHANERVVVPILSLFLVRGQRPLVSGSPTTRVRRPLTGTALSPHRSIHPANSLFLSPSSSSSYSSSSSTAFHVDFFWWLTYHSPLTHFYEYSIALLLSDWSELICISFAYPVSPETRSFNPKGPSPYILTTINLIHSFFIEKKNGNLIFFFCVFRVFSGGAFSRRFSTVRALKTNSVPFCVSTATGASTAVWRSASLSACPVTVSNSLFPLIISNSLLFLPIITSPLRLFPSAPLVIVCVGGGGH